MKSTKRMIPIIVAATAILATTSCKLGSDTPSPQSPTQDAVSSNAGKHISTQCTNVFKKLLPFDCNLIDKTNPQAANSCRRLPLGFRGALFYSALAEKTNFCESNQAENLTEQAYYDIALNTFLELNPGVDQALNEMISNQDINTENNMTLAKMQINLSEGKQPNVGITDNPLEMMNFENAIQGVYIYANLCLNSTNEICEPFKQIYQEQTNLFIEQFELFKSYCSSLYIAGYPQYLSSIDHETIIAIQKLVAKLFAMYKYTGKIPNDLDALLNYNDIQCSDTGLLRSVKLDLKSRHFQYIIVPDNCETMLRQPVSDLNSRKLVENVVSLSRYDISSYSYLLNPRFYKYTYDNGQISIASDGPDGIPETSDDIIYSITEKELQHLTKYLAEHPDELRQTEIQVRNDLIRQEFGDYNDLLLPSNDNQIYFFINYTSPDSYKIFTYLHKSAEDDVTLKTNNVSISYIHYPVVNGMPDLVSYYAALGASTASTQMKKDCSQEAAISESFSTYQLTLFILMQKSQALTINILKEMAKYIFSTPDIRYYLSCFNLDEFSESLDNQTEASSIQSSIKLANILDIHEAPAIVLVKPGQTITEGTVMDLSSLSKEQFIQKVDQTFE